MDAQRELQGRILQKLEDKKNCSEKVLRLLYIAYIIRKRFRNVYKITVKSCVPVFICCIYYIYDM